VKKSEKGAKGWGGSQVVIRLKKIKEEGLIRGGTKSTVRERGSEGKEGQLETKRRRQGGERARGGVWETHHCEEYLPRNKRWGSSH